MIEKIKRQNVLIEKTADELNNLEFTFVDTQTLTNLCKEYHKIEKDISREYTKRKRLWQFSQIICFVLLGFSAGYILPSNNIILLFGATLFLGITLGIIIVFILLRKLKT